MYLRLKHETCCYNVAYPLKVSFLITFYSVHMYEGRQHFHAMCFTFSFSPPLALMWGKQALHSSGQL